MQKLPFILLLLASFQVFSQGAWVRKNDFPGTGRKAGAAFSLGGKGYAGTGISQTGLLNDFWEYNPSGDQWTQRADLPDSARSYAAGISTGSAGYMGIGSAADGLRKDFYEYNAAGNSWIQKTAFAGTARQKSASFSVGGKCYIGTGTDVNSYHKDLWEYDPVTDSWSQKADIPGRERIGSVGFSIGNKGYIGLGFSNVGDYRRELYEYNPSGNYWVRIPDDFPGAGREDAVSFGDDALGKGYIICGYMRTTTYLSDCWEFDQAKQEWKKLATVGGGGRRGAVGFAINGTAYVGLGIDSVGNYLKDFYEYRLPTGISQRGIESAGVFPNPFKDRIALNGLKEDVYFVMYDISGKMVYEAFLPLDESPVVSPAALPQGSYFYILKSRTGDMLSQGKLMKAD